MNPKVSVLMPAFNPGNYIISAISSIIAQDFEDFELIIFNDGSTDNTDQIIRGFESVDSRIKYIHSRVNQGIFIARDRLIEEAKGEYIAWMDSDDISMPNRLRKQCFFLDHNPEIFAVGGAIGHPGIDTIKTPYSKATELQAALLVFAPILPPAMMFRVDIIRQHKFKFEDYIALKSSEDHVFLTKFVIHYGYQISALSDCIYLYRLHEHQESYSQHSRQIRAAKEIISENFKVLNVIVDEYLIDSIVLKQREKRTFTSIQAVSVCELYKTAIKNNKSLGIFNQRMLEKHLMISAKVILRTMGIYGVKTFIRIFGWSAFFAGKKLGMAFLQDCCKFEQRNKQQNRNMS